MEGLLLGWDGVSRAPRGIGFVEKAAPVDDNPKLIHEDTDAHVLGCAGTGGGKGRAFAVPNLLTWPGGAIVVDVKSELYHVTARHRRTLGPVVAIDPFRQATDGSGAFNPLAQLDPEAPDFVDNLYALANLFSSQSGFSQKDGRFWDDWGADVIAAIAAFVASDPACADRSFGNVYNLLHTDDVIYDLGRQLDGPAKHPFTRATIGSFLSLPEQTRGGVLSAACQQTRLLASGGVQKSLSCNTLDPEIIRRGEPFTIYLIWPPDKLESHAALLRVFLTGLTHVMMGRRRKPCFPTLLLVDEAGQLGEIPALVAATTLGRGYGICIAWLFQSYAQLRATYPRHHEAIMENCGTVFTFGRPRSYLMARTLADLAFCDVSADAVFGLGVGELLMRRSGEVSRVAGKLDYLNDPIFAGRYDANPLHTEDGPGL